MYSNCTYSLIATFCGVISRFKTSSKSVLFHDGIWLQLQRNAIHLSDSFHLSKSVNRNRLPSVQLRKSLLFSLFSNNMSSSPAVRSDCIFCNIVNKLEETEILYEDDQVCVFRDIKPASQFHILTIPKRHIEDCTSLTSADKELVQHMLSVAHDLLTKNNLSLEDARLGYHWPPFRSVKHLHLHTIAPESNMGFISRMIFKRDSFWFVSPEYVASRL